MPECHDSCQTFSKMFKADRLNVSVKEFANNSESYKEDSDSTEQGHHHEVGNELEGFIFHSGE